MNPLYIFVVLALASAGYFVYKRLSHKGKQTKGIDSLKPYTNLKLHGPAGRLNGTLVERFDEKVRIRVKHEKQPKSMLRVGDELSVLMPGDNCVVSFTCQILVVDEDQEYITVTEPVEVDLSDRRRSDRSYAVAGVKTKISGHEATFINMGSRGARLSSSMPHKAGSYLELHVPAFPAYVRAIVLECIPPADSMGEYTLRIQFERPVRSKVKAA